MNYLMSRMCYYTSLFLLVLGMTSFSTVIFAQDGPNIYLESSEFTKKGATAWKEGVVVSNFVFRTIDNKRFKLYDLLEKPLVIEFWNPESSIIKENQTALKSYYSGFEVNILSICSDKFEDQINTLVANQNLPWSVICDNYHRYNGKSFRATHKMANAGYVVITPDRKVRIIADIADIAAVKATVEQFAKKK